MTGPKSLLQMMDEKADQIRESKGLPAVPAQQQTFSDADKKAMEVVFNQLLQIFPGGLKQFPGDNDFSRFKAQFIKGLLDSKIRRREQFEKAFRKARERIYPTLPTIGEFLLWCKREPEDYGYPNVKQALWEVVHHYRDISPAARLAGRKTKYERGTMSAEAYEDVFAIAYSEIVFDAVDNNRDLDAEIASAIDYKSPDPVKSDPTVGGWHLDKIHEMFHGPKTIKTKSDLTPEELEIDRILRVIKKRKKMGFSLTKEDQEFMEAHRGNGDQGES